MLFELSHSDKPTLRARSDAVQTVRLGEMGMPAARTMLFELLHSYKTDATCSFGCCSNWETGRKGKVRGARTGESEKPDSSATTVAEGKLHAVSGALPGDNKTTVRSSGARIAGLAAGQDGARVQGSGEPVSRRLATVVAGNTVSGASSLLR